MLILAVVLIIAIGLFLIGVVWSDAPAMLGWFGLESATSGRVLVVGGIVIAALFALALRLLRSGLSRDRQRRRELKDLRAREKALEVLQKPIRPAKAAKPETPQRPEPAEAQRNGPLERKAAPTTETGSGPAEPPLT